MIPVMTRKGYSPEYAVGVTISSAIQGVIVPPSHNLVLYSIVASGIAGGVSVARLFLAGVVPGFVLLATLITVGLIISRARGYPRGDPVERREIPSIVFHGLLSLTPAVIILGEHHLRVGHRHGGRRPRDGLLARPGGAVAIAI